MLKMLGNARNAEIAEKQNQMLVNFFLTKATQGEGKEDYRVSKIGVARGNLNYNYTRPN